MDANHGDVTLETLLQHRDWVRRLARALSRDEASADDVEQTAWVTAMRSPPRHAGNLRAWLASLVRTTARSIARGDERRTRRERATAREPHVSPHDTLERAELSRRLVEIVMALREPYRTAVVLAYFDDLSPAEVAERTGVPATTARGRIHRGLALVREELDRDHDGGRGAWLAALVPLAGDGSRRSLGSAATASAVVGGFVMSTKTKIAAGIVLVMLAGLLAWRRNAGLEPQREAPLERTVRAVAAPNAAVSNEVVPRFERMDASASSSTVSADFRSSVDVEVTWERDGSPAVNVGVALVRWDAALRKVARTTTTDALGRARFEDVPSGRANVVVDRGAVEHITVEPPRPSHVVLRVPDGPRVRGRVVEEDGAPIAAADVRLSWSDDSSSDTSLVATTNDDGRFDLGTVSAGHYASARAAGHSPSHAHQIAGAPGADVELTLVMRGRGGSVEGRVTDASGAAIAGASVEVGDPFDGSIRLPDGAHGATPPALRVSTASDGTYRVEGVAPGATTVVARAEGLAASSAVADVRAGIVSRIDLALGHGGTLRGTLTTSDRVAASAVRIDVDASNDPGFALVRTQGDGSYAIDHLPAGKHKVVAEGAALGRAETTFEVREGEVVEWSPVLDCGRSVAGRAQDVDGTALVNALVSVSPSDPERLTPEQDAVYWKRGLRPWGARTDADGRFRVCDVIDAPLRIEVRPASALAGAAIVHVDDVRAPVSDLVLVAGPAPRATISGRVTDAGGAAIPNATVLAYETPARAEAPVSSVVSDADGRFRITALRPATYGLRVSREGFVRAESGEHDLEGVNDLDVGTIVLARGASIVARLESASGSLPPGVVVQAREWKGRRNASFTLFGARAESERIEPASWVVTARTSDGKTLARVLVRVDAEREFEVVLDLP